MTLLGWTVQMWYYRWAFECIICFFFFFSQGGGVNCLNFDFKSGVRGCRFSHTLIIEPGAWKAIRGPPELVLKLLLTCIPVSYVIPLCFTTAALLRTWAALVLSWVTSSCRAVWPTVPMNYLVQLLEMWMEIVQRFEHVWGFNLAVLIGACRSLNSS